LKLLSLSTAEQGCSLAITEDDTIVCEEFWINNLTHSKRVLTMIEHMLEKRACIKLDDIDCFIASKGPGSFTGLRIGISVIKGMACALDKPAAGASSLDGIAFRVKYSSIPICVMMDARRDEVYCALYKFDQGKLVSKTREMVADPEKTIEMIKGATLFVGSGSKVYKNIIEQKAEKPVIAHNFQDHVSAAAMVQSLYSKDGFLHDPENILKPSYIRKSDAQLKFVTAC
jgi:tRNA threonylcarbamoyladenosine biosynthesis protein TsaB